MSIPSGRDKSLPFLDPPDGPDCMGLLGRYRVLRLLGRGGMGVVFLARDPVLDRLVAIKAVSPQLCGSPAGQQRLLREARAAAAINHPNVVTIYSAEEVSGLLLLVMEFVDGISLQQHVEFEGPLPLAEIVRIGAELASGLASAHACGVVHRDIKPANILLARPAGQVKITDFGLARAADDAALTRSGVVLGTPSYMAPEQARGGAVDYRADLYSLGSVLYAMSRAAPPYSGSTLAVIRAVADNQPAALEPSGEAIPQWLVDLVTKLHATDPAGRFQSAAEVAEMLYERLPRGGESRLALPSRMLAAPATSCVASTVEVVPTPPPLASKEIVGPPRQTLRPASPPARPRDTRWRTSIVLGLLCLALLAAVVGLAYKKRSPVVAAANGGQLPLRPLAARQPFVLVRAKGGARQAFAGLDAAVRDARSGDTIEIRGNEPCRLPSVHLHAKSLTLRSAAGTRPVLWVPPADETGDAPPIQTDSSLALEGLDIESLPAKGKHAPPTILYVRQGPLSLVNCRLLHAGAGPAARLEDLAECEIRNCILHAANGCSIDCFSRRRFQLTAVNNIFSGLSAIVVHQAGPDATEAALALRRNTLVVREALRVHMDGGGVSGAKGGEWRSVVHIDSRRNFIDAGGALLTFQSDWTTPQEVERVGQLARVDAGGRANPAAKKNLGPPPRVVIDGLKKIIAMHNEQDVYCGSGTLLGMASSQNPGVVAGIAFPATVAEWNQFWGISPPGLVRLADGWLDGAALRTRAMADPRSLQAADYCRRFTAPRRPDEAAVEGAHTMIVGPGVPLATWKNTIDFRTWSQSRRQGSGL